MGCRFGPKPFFGLQYKVQCTDGKCKNCDCNAPDSLCVTWCALTKNCPSAEVTRGTCPTSDVPRHLPRTAKGGADDWLRADA